MPVSGVATSGARARKRCLNTALDAIALTGTKSVKEIGPQKSLRKQGKRKEYQQRRKHGERKTNKENNPRGGDRRTFQANRKKANA